jgi:hypothetical protein
MYTPNLSHCTPSTTFLRLHNPLESLLRNLRFRSSDDSRRIRVTKSTSRLSILLARRLSTADAIASSCDLRAACRAAIGVTHAATCDELRAVTGSDVFGASVVGRDLRERSGGNLRANVS